MHYGNKRGSDHWNGNDTDDDIEEGMDGQSEQSMVKVRFTGLIANVDDSILGVPLPNDLLFQRIDIEEMVSLIGSPALLAFPPDPEDGGSPCSPERSFHKLLHDLHCLSPGSDRGYAITWEGSVPISSNGKGTRGRSKKHDNERSLASMMEDPSEFGLGSATGTEPGSASLFNTGTGTAYRDVTRLYHSLEGSSLEPILRSMRLHHKGNIRMPIRSLSWTLSYGRSYSRLWPHEPHSVTNERFSIAPSEIPDLVKFMGSFSFDTLDPSMKRPLHFFEASFDHSDRMVVVGLLLDCLTGLVSPSAEIFGIEDRYRNIRRGVARNIAVLLGENRERARNIQHDVEDIFDRRERSVTGGPEALVQKLDVVKCRAYARAVIREVLAIGGSRPELLRMLEQGAHGKRAWKRSR